MKTPLLLTVALLAWLMAQPGSQAQQAQLVGPPTQQPPRTFALNT